MADFTSSNKIYGGLYEVGFVLNATDSNQISITMLDESDGLQLIINNENLDEETGECEDGYEPFRITISEKDRSKFAKYLRIAANMIDRSRPNVQKPAKS